MPSRVSSRWVRDDTELAVLIVEDEFLIRCGLADTFRDNDIEALEAAHADEAIDLLNSRDDIDLVITDVDMPNGSMNGLDLAQTIRDRWPPVNIFVMSGYRRPAQGKMPENTRYFSKPYSFYAVVKEALRLH